MWSWYERQKTAMPSGGKPVRRENTKIKTPAHINLLFNSKHYVLSSLFVPHLSLAAGR